MSTSTRTRTSISISISSLGQVLFLALVLLQGSGCIPLLLSAAPLHIRALSAANRTATVERVLKSLTTHHMEYTNGLIN